MLLLINLYWRYICRRWRLGSLLCADWLLMTKSWFLIVFISTWSISKIVPTISIIIATKIAVALVTRVSVTTVTITSSLLSIIGSITRSWSIWSWIWLLRTIWPRSSIHLTFRWCRWSRILLSKQQVTWQLLENSSSGYLVAMITIKLVVASLVPSGVLTSIILPSAIRNNLLQIECSKICKWPWILVCSGVLMIWWRILQIISRCFFSSPASLFKLFKI